MPSRLMVGHLPLEDGIPGSSPGSATTPHHDQPPFHAKILSVAGEDPKHTTPNL